MKHIIWTGIVRGSDGKDIIREAYQKTINKLNGMPELLKLKLTINSKNEYKIVYTQKIREDLQWVFVFVDTFTDELTKELFKDVE